MLRWSQQFNDVAPELEQEQNVRIKELEGQLEQDLDSLEVRYFNAIGENLRRPDLGPAGLALAGQDIHQVNTNPCRSGRGPVLPASSPGQVLRIFVLSTCCAWEPLRNYQPDRLGSRKASLMRKTSGSSQLPCMPTMSKRQAAAGRRSPRR